MITNISSLADTALNEAFAMSEPFFDHPFLTGHHAPVRFEADAPDLIVEGTIPDDLSGIF